MRQRGNHSESSLDLLLDTMTNAFGGVVFLAILIAIQLKERSFSNMPEVDTERQVEMIQLAGRKGVLTKKLQWLEQQANRPLVDESRGVALDDGKLSEFESIDARYQELLAERSELYAQFTKGEERLKERRQAAQERLAKLENEETTQDEQDEIVAIQTEMKAKRAELESEKERRTITGKLPVRKSAGNLREFHVVVRYGRVYSTRINGVLNIRDFTLVDRMFIPKPTHGTSVEEFSDRPQLQAIPTRNYVTIFVWEDSFGHFQLVKRALVKQRFKYRLELLRNDDELYVGAGGGGDGMVQ